MDIEQIQVNELDKQYEISGGKQMAQNHLIPQGNVATGLKKYRCQENIATGCLYKNVGNKGSIEDKMVQATGMKDRNFYETYGSDIQLQNNQLFEPGFSECKTNVSKS